MGNGLIGWLPDSVQTAIVIVFFIIPGLLVFAMGILWPFIFWTAFWDRLMKERTEQIEFKKAKMNKKESIFWYIGLTFSMVVALIMYILWVRWLWSFFDTDNGWFLDILHGKGN